MPISGVKDYGVNINRTRNKEYCRFCFLDGKFTEPNITLDQMINKVAVVMAERMGLTEERARLMAEGLVPKLRRWEK